MPNSCSASEPSPSSRSFEARLALFGASNLSVVFFGLADALGLALPSSEIELYVAKGPGRGYGLPGGAFRRIYRPHIKTSLLSDFLGSLPSAEPGTSRTPSTVARAFLMDVGNDLVYGAQPDQILDWVRGLVAPLTDRSVPVTIALPPVLSLLRMSSLRFHLVRRVLFPRASFSLEEMRRRVVDLADGITELSGPLVRVESGLAGYVGGDSIHFAWRSLGEVTRMIGDHLLLDHPASGPTPRLPVGRILGSAWRSRGLMPKEMGFDGKLGTAEPFCYRLSDGFRVSLY